MTFRRIEPEKLSHAVVRQIEDLILRGILRPGERLPAERDLAERLGVSRPSLRAAVGELTERGLLTTRAGSGIYVADVLGSAFSPALVCLIESNDMAVFDYLAFRRDLEALAAERAAENASDADLAVIDTIHAKMLAQHARPDQAGEARLDAEFHMAIMEAAHNIIMLHMMRSMFDLLRQGVFYNRSSVFKPGTSRITLLDQHGAINDALQARDPARARAAVVAHLDYVEAALREQRRSEANADIAMRRLQHEQDRPGRI